MKKRGRRLGTHIKITSDVRMNRLLSAEQRAAGRDARLSIRT
jgi:hypothetical protein